MNYCMSEYADHRSQHYTYIAYHHVSDIRAGLNNSSNGKEIGAEAELFDLAAMRRQK